MRWFAFLWLFPACEPEPPTIQTYGCTKSAIRKVQVCEDDNLALAGGLAGLMIAGPIGGVLGAVAGYGTKQTCHEEEQEYCVSSGYITRPNPRYKKQEN